MKTLIFLLPLFTIFSSTVTFAKKANPIYPETGVNNNQPVFVGIPDLIEDGDSFWIGIHKVRLFGIDAPESKQKCGTIYCGQKARDFLKNIAPNKPFSCTLHQGKYGKPWIMYGRYVVTCKVGSINVNEKMVKSGWAVASEKSYGESFRHFQAFAEKKKLGIHLTTFLSPKSYRRKLRNTKRCIDENNYIATSSNPLPFSKATDTFLKNAK